MGELAVVTGASSGIGVAIARRLARAGYDLLLVARRAERLEAVREELSSVAEGSVAVLALDVTEPAAAERLVVAALELAPGRGVGVLVNNAGLGRFGPVLSHDAERHLEEIRLNCEALTALTLAVLPGMVRREEGRIVNLGSIAGLQPVPYYAVYGATKAYVQSLSEALDEELRAKNVRVSVVAPGPVPTEFQENAGSPDAHETPAYALRTPEQIAEEVMAAIVRPRRLVIPARYHRLMHFVQRFLPRDFVTGFAAKKMRKRVDE